MTDMMLKARLSISREYATTLAAQIVEILQNRYYVTADGIRVEIGAQIDEAVNGTVSYPPEITLSTQTSQKKQPIITVRNETTFTAVENLVVMGFKPAALNLASATSPGGGFLKGARAQEEYLARSSTLYACLRDNPMYAYHSARLDAFYSDYVLYSPNVLVLRNDDGELRLPYSCAIITSPAVNAAAVQKYASARMGDIAAAMWTRLLKVLAVAEKHGHDTLVLGAWGCGAFGNSGDVIAGLFHQALTQNFQGAFSRIVFAITDWSEEQRFIGPFARAFASSRGQ